MAALLKTLIAFACVAAIAASGIWLLDRQNRLTAEAEASTERAAARQAAVDMRARERVAACRDDLAAYDGGSILAFVVRAKGGDILAEVARCRETVRRGY